MFGFLKRKNKETQKNSVENTDKLDKKDFYKKGTFGKKNKKIKINESELIHIKDNVEETQQQPTSKELLFLKNDELSQYKKKVTLRLTKKFDIVNKLTPYELKAFSEVYQLGYVVSYAKIAPTWVNNYDLLFIGEGSAVMISRQLTNVGDLDTVEDIMNSEFTISVINTLLFKIDFIINHLIKLFNDGKNYNIHLIDAAKELVNFELINGETHRNLLFIANIRKYLSTAKSIEKVYYKDSFGRLELLKDREIQFKELLAETYLSLIEKYLEVQKPFLKKFYILSKSRNLNISTPKEFYYM